MLRYASRTEHIDRLMRLLAEVLQVPIAFFDIDQRRLESFDTGPDSAYCSTLRRDTAFNRACEQCDRAHLLQAQRSGGIHTYICHNNLRETAVPLFDEDHNYLGAIVFGQIRVPGLRPPGRGTAALRRLYEQLPDYPESQVRKIAALLACFAQYMIQNHLVQVRGAPWAEAIRLHIAAHLHEQLDIGALARAGGVSVSQVSHRFARECGLSPAAYVRRERLRRAQELLGRGRRVKEVAYALGFCDEFHFSKLFKRQFGQGPREWALRQQP